jgi:hypothetical protein
MWFFYTLATLLIWFVAALFFWMVINNDKYSDSSERWWHKILMLPLSVVLYLIHINSAFQERR